MSAYAPRADPAATRGICRSRCGRAERCRYAITSHLSGRGGRCHADAGARLRAAAASLGGPRSARGLCEHCRQLSGRAGVGALAAVGLSALVAANQLAYDVLHVAGAAFLGWLGVRAFLATTTSDRADAADANDSVRSVPPGAVTSAVWRAGRRGLLNSLANPKLAVAGARDGGGCHDLTTGGSLRGASGPGFVCEQVPPSIGVRPPTGDMQVAAPFELRSCFDVGTVLPPGADHTPEFVPD